MSGRKQARRASRATYKWYRGKKFWPWNTPDDSAATLEMGPPQGSTQPTRSTSPCGLNPPPGLTPAFEPVSTSPRESTPAMGSESTAPCKSTSAIESVAPFASASPPTLDPLGPQGVDMPKMEQVLTR
ncbi:uncharacterized protein N7477_001778 [Penicillium maclennaniae]|uniref:uncharacterized protein n=1 Tax=Penicillium maclennaniae TaxID=1343394 RepID=UPI0025424A01|nr:uncharacterized protein N7477_001778 [Penicillium maclennaniae]KAJ5681838.1 hypothetical protein N7477_001778 [Penicillium maclennaniae]